jgi:hypothetical protein
MFVLEFAVVSNINTTRRDPPLLGHTPYLYPVLGLYYWQHIAMERQDLFKAG